MARSQALSLFCRDELSVHMNIDDPVAQLEGLFIDNLGQDWDVLDSPEETILRVPKGTVESLLRQINTKGLWPSLYAAAKRHSEQWMLDLSAFFPREEEFIEPLVLFLLMSKEDHTQICFAQDADQWAWGPNTVHLLPKVIERIREIREKVDRRNFEPVIPTLDRVVKALSDLASHTS